MPDNPVRINSREELIYLLSEAAEVEHGVMCSYLFAAFSLKDRVSDGLRGSLPEDHRSALFTGRMRFWFPTGQNAFHTRSKLRSCIAGRAISSGSC